MKKVDAAFFAYPSNPAEIADVIQAAFPKHSTKQNRSVQLWPMIDTFGAMIPDQVRNAIKSARTIICDITEPNPNVYYEMGYGIGMGKPVLPVVNVSFADAEQRVKRQGLFDSIGFGKYENSVELKALIENVGETALSELYRKPIDFRQPLFLLDTLSKTDFRNSIFSAVKTSRVYFKSFDPVETPRFNTIQIIGDVSSSAGVLVPFLGSHIVDSNLHNLRAAFVAGLAHGIGRQTLMLKLASDREISPADFRDDISVIRDPRSLATLVVEFAHATTVEAQSIDSAGPLFTSNKSISLGAVAAENEFRSLSQYFVETSEFFRAVRGDVNVVTGRKGAGKSAIFFRVRDVLHARNDSIVVDLKPESHQLGQFRTNLVEMTDIGMADHTIAAFWYFVILSEIVLQLRKSSETRMGRDQEALDLYNKCSDLLGEYSLLQAGDFTTRINSSTKFFREEIEAASRSGRQIGVSELTNIIYSRAAPAFRDLIIRSTNPDSKIALLFDNIDKGWPAAGVQEFDLVVVRLLLEALTKVQQDLATKARNFQSIVFIRNDIFELLVNSTPDRGKSGKVSIDWTDRAKLKQVIYRRLQVTLNNTNDPFSKLWQSVFPNVILERDSFDYFVDHSLMRPRFLIAIIELAISNSVNRGHARVSVEDCKDAVKQHAFSLVDDFGYEIRDVSGLTEEILYAFVGAPQIMTRSEVETKLLDVGIDEEAWKVAFKLLLWYGGLGIYLGGNRSQYIFDFEYNMKRLEAEMRRTGEATKYIINPGLYAALQ